MLLAREPHSRLHMGSRDHFRTRGYSVGPTTLSHPNLKLLGFRVNPDAQIAVGTKHQTAAGANSLRTLGVGSGLQVWPLASNPRHSQSAKKGPQAGGNCLRTLGVGSGLRVWPLASNPRRSKCQKGGPRGTPVKSKKTKSFLGGAVSLKLPTFSRRGFWTSGVEFGLQSSRF